MHANHLIFRTSWVFDSWGQNFLKSILRAAHQRDSLNVVNDQWGAPTRAALMADVTAHALARLRGGGQDRPAGIYHLAAAGVTQWHEYASFAIARSACCRHARPGTRHPPHCGHAVPDARRAASEFAPGHHAPAQTFGLVLPPWQDGVRAVVAELAANFS
jgi:dTDP-4-dehydrorhamnose reductase